MNDLSRTICVGCDPHLLRLRCLVLATRLPHVESALIDVLPGVMEARRFDLMVLCHTMDAANCAFALHLFQERCPGGWTVALHTNTRGCAMGYVDAEASSLDGPAGLFRAIDRAQERGRPMLVPPLPTVRALPAAGAARREVCASNPPGASHGQVQRLG